METLQETARILTSKPVQRAVVNTTLLVTTAATLFGLAGIASALFFRNFVPDQVVSTPVHLQYGSALNPYGVASITSPTIKSTQAYDVSVTLTIPRSPPNVERGNFMVSLHLLDADVSPQLHDAARTFANDHESFSGTSILFSSRRTALVPYVDPIVSLASRVLFLFWHMLVPKSQTCALTVKLAERVLIPKRSILPRSAFVEVEAGQTIQIYEVALHLTAQLRGLRWLMFHYRLPTYIAFTFLFWVCEVVFMCIVWSIWGGGSEPEYHKAGKRASLSDDEGGTTSPADAQRSLKSEPYIKEEADLQRLLSEIPAAGAEADDEDELDEGMGPSTSRGAAVGTGFGKEGQESIRKRPSRKLSE